MTKENREWLEIALLLGEDNMTLFHDSRWEWICEYDVFMNAYVRFGGDADTHFTNDEALEQTIEYAYMKIQDCFEEICRRMMRLK
jgi:hypothetical protein